MAWGSHSKKEIIIDTERLYTKIMEAICQEHGHTFTWDIKVKQMGKKEREAAKVLIDELNLPISIDDYVSTNHRLQKELFPHAELMPGAERLIQHLHKNNIPIAVATGSDKQGYDLKTSSHIELFKLFSHIVLSSEDPDVKHGKPAPDCFNVASDRFSSKPQTPQQVLVFEDAPNGLQGALAAGMQCVWVPDPNVNKATLEKEATLVLDSLEQFKPEIFGLPPYDNE